MNRLNACKDCEHHRDYGGKHGMCYCGDKMKEIDSLVLDCKNKEEVKERVVEFVSYDGEYPNLCSGILTIRINGKEYELPEYCLESGGCVSFTEDYDEIVTIGEWRLSDTFKLQKELEPYKEEILKVINENVPLGCCGGCV